MRQAHPLTDTWCEADEMSALGHEQPSRHVRVLSVIPLKADIHQRGMHVRLVPLTNIGSAVIEVSLQGEEKMRRGLVLRLQPLNFRFLTSRQEPCVLRGVPHRSQHP